MSARLSSEARGSERLSARRRQRRRRIFIFLSILFALLLSAVVYELNQSALRISRITVYGADESFSNIAAAAMQGTYLGIIPRDSTFFFPASSIRADIISAHPDIAAVSIFRNGLTGLSIKVNDRVPIARWCGLSPTRFDLTASSSRSNLVGEGHGSDEYCYVFDASGYLYAADATTTEPLNSFSLYARLAGDTQEPLRATLVHADQLPSVFDFARQIGTFGEPVIRIVLRDDEVDDYLASGTRITYILEHEQDAFTALVSARDTLDLADGSIDYIDLRFDGKVYVKRK
ncbi:MAG: hypothetical protein PHD04_02960 [Candidatus Pacebacteria bacterium]|nr:hypothetical protein [Candidatus Paceibacterota bacterium]